MGRRVNKAELSEIIGISERSLTEWQKEDGFPILYDGARGESNEYDCADVIAWYVRREVSKVQAETQEQRLKRLQADEIEDRLKRQRGQVVSLAELEPEIAGMVLTVRQEILNVPNALPIDDEMRALIAERLADALRGLSKYEPGEGPDTADFAPLAAAGSPIGGAMGGDEASPRGELAFSGTVPPVADAVPARGAGLPDGSARA